MLTQTTQVKPRRRCLPLPDRIATTTLRNSRLLLLLMKLDGATAVLDGVAMMTKASVVAVNALIITGEHDFEGAGPG